jgi:hypothetical protein
MTSLNLSRNDLGDKGAKYLADALKVGLCVCDWFEGLPYTFAVIGAHGLWLSLEYCWHRGCNGIMRV